MTFDCTLQRLRLTEVINRATLVSRKSNARFLSEAAFRTPEQRLGPTSLLGREQPVGFRHPWPATVGRSAGPG